MLLLCFVFKQHHRCNYIRCCKSQHRSNSLINTHSKPKPWNGRWVCVTLHVFRFICSTYLTWAMEIEAINVGFKRIDDFIFLVWFLCHYCICVRLYMPSHVSVCGDESWGQWERKHFKTLMRVQQEGVDHKLYFQKSNKVVSTYKASYIINGKGCRPILSSIMYPKIMIYVTKIDTARLSPLTRIWILISFEWVFGVYLCGIFICVGTRG